MLSHLCRVCLLPPKLGDQQDIGLICDEDDNLSYGDCFKAITNIDLTLDIGGGEPEMLCKTCGLELQMAYDFHKKVEHAKTQIQQYLEASASTAQGSTEAMSFEAEKAVTDDALDSDVAEYEGEEEDAEQMPIEGDAVENLNEKTDFFKMVSEVSEDCDYLVEENTVEEYQTIELYNAREEEDNFEVGNLIIDENNSEPKIVEFIAEDFVVENDDSRQPDNFIEEYGEQFECSDAAEEQIDDPVPFQRNPDAFKTNAPKSGTTVRKGPRIMGPIACDICHKQFPNHSKMKWHQRMHDTNRTLYHCPAPDCDKFYASKQSANIHYKQTHLDEGVVCPVCSKRFAIPQTLNVHMRYHTKEYPYACQVCGKKFAQKGHLTTHMQVKHNNLRYVWRL